MDTTWIALHRKIRESRVFGNGEVLRVWIWCLLEASWTERWETVNTGRGTTEVQLQPGQFVYQRNHAAKALKLAPSTLRNHMSKLALWGNVDNQVDNQYTLVTICNWAQYQGRNGAAGQLVGQPEDNQRTTKLSPERGVGGRARPEGRELTGKQGEQKKERGTAPPLDFLSVETWWNDLAEKHGLAKIRGLSAKRKSHVKARAKEGRLDQLDELSEIIAETPFLLGDNDRGWRMDFDFLFGSETNWLKVIEGKFERKPVRSWTDELSDELAAKREADGR